MRLPFLIAYLCLFILSGTMAFADEALTCPFTTDDPMSNKLFASVQYLETTVNSIGCQDDAKMKELQELQKQLTINVKKLSELGQEVSSKDDSAEATATLEEGANVSTLILQNLQGMGNIITQDFAKGDCGYKALSTGDLVLSFVQSVRSISPVMLPFLGSADTSLKQMVLLAWLGATAVEKTFQMWRAGRIDMHEMKYMSAFEQSACIIYEVNERLRGMSSVMEGNFDELDQEKSALKKKLTNARKSAPVENEIAKMDAALDSDFKAVQALRDELKNITDDRLTCAKLREYLDEFGKYVAFGTKPSDGVRFSHKYPKNSFDSLGQLIQITKRRTSKPYLKSEESIRSFKTLTQFLVNRSGKKECKKSADDWMNGLDNILTRTKAEIAFNGKQDESFQNYLKWKNSLALMEQRIDELDRLGTSVKNMKNTVETTGGLFRASNILHLNDQGQKTFFDGKRQDLFTHLFFPQQSPVMKWLELKYELANTNVDETIAQFEQHNELLSRNPDFPAPTDPEKTCQDQPGLPYCTLCRVDEKGIQDWQTAKVHIDAAKGFCKAFQSTNVLTEERYPKAYSYCFKKIEEADKNLEKTSEIEEIFLKWRDKLDCPLPKITNLL